MTVTIQHANRFTYLEMSYKKNKKKKKKAEEIKLFLNNHSQRLVLDGVVQSISQANRGHERAKEVSSVFPLQLIRWQWKTMQEEFGLSWAQIKWCSKNIIFLIEN